MKILQLPALLLVFFFTNCKKENPLQTSNNSTNSAASYSKEGGSGINVENDYLAFENGAVFKSTIDDLKEMTEKERLLWEEKFTGFKSMDAEFNENREKDTLHFWEMQFHPELPQDALIKHCEEIIEEKQMYIKYYFDRKENQYEEYTGEENENDMDYLLLKNINNEKYASLVNDNGIVKIGSTLYQFTHEWIKSIEDNGPGSVDELINARPKSGSGVVFNGAMQDPVIDGAVQSGCDFAGNSGNTWSTESSVEWSSSPKYRLFLKGTHFFRNDFYCPSLYTPCVETYADAFKKSWNNINWQQASTPMTLEVSYTYSHPNGTTANAYTYFGASNWRIQSFNSWPQINSQSYTTMFNAYNFYARATMNGGTAGNATTISH